MRGEKRENEFHIIVNHEKLEEIRSRDGTTYVVMPLFSKVSYGSEFVEEIKGHGKIEVITQKWPVCPYTVAVRNNSPKGNFALLYVDGQKVAEKHVHAGSHVTFEGIPTENGIQELLFSLPRFATIREKAIGGKALPSEQASEIGTVKVVWRDCVKTHQSFSNNYRSYGTTSFTQANKNDAKSTGDDGGSGGSGSNKAFASTTRAGKVVGLNEAKSCNVTHYSYVGEPWSARLLYRTEMYLQDIGVLSKPEGDESEIAARRARRKRRRERNRQMAEAENGGAPCPPPVPVEDGPPPVPSREEEDGA